MSEKADALEGLLTHPGWAMFTEHVREEWGPTGVRYNAELDKALDLTDPNAAASQARQVRAGRKVIESLLTWPADELGRLQRSDRAPVLTMSRRGGL